MDAAGTVAASRPPFRLSMYLIRRSLEARSGGLREDAAGPNVRLPYREEVGPNKSQTAWGEAREGPSYNILGRPLRVHRRLVGAVDIQNRRGQNHGCLSHH